MPKKTTQKNREENFEVRIRSTGDVLKTGES